MSGFTKVSARTLAQPLCWTVCLTLLALICSGFAAAQLPMPPSTQFDITGFLQEAKVSNIGDPLSAGTLKVNGQQITVPRNVIVILPANALTWQELFAKAPAPYAGTGQTGLAMTDSPAPMTTFEVHVIGNRVPGAAGGDQYIAGMVEIAQQSLNSGAGFINYIDYGVGEMRVGGTIGDPNCAQSPAGTNGPAGGANCSGARLRINDPLGRYGRSNSPDVRFTVDPDNPTIMAGTGYPMCLPRTDPNGAAPDQICPEGNRPRVVDPVLGLIPMPSFTTANLTSNCGGACAPLPPGTFPDSTRQAPIEVGDYITYSGLLVRDCPTCVGGGSLVGPIPANPAQAFTSADTIVDNIAVYTYPGSNPAYVEIDVGIIGTGGLTVLGAGEAAIRSRWEGMTTDSTRSIHLYGMDWDSQGNQTDRDFGTIGVDPGPAGGAGAVQGRWRFRPPCLPFGSNPAKPDKQCVMNQAGSFLPPPREVRAVIEGLQSNIPGAPNAVAVANGLYYGQYHAPIDEYIFPENVPGTPIVENNFNAIPFISCGGYSSSGIDFPPPPGAPPLVGTVAPGPLSPWPSNIAPDTSACAGFVAAPSSVLAAATPSAVIAGSNAVVGLSATASGTGPLAFTWAQAATDTVRVVLANANTANASFVTPNIAATTTLNFIVTATNSAGSASANVSVTVAVDIPVVNHIPAQTVFAGSPVTVVASGVDPAGLPLTFTWTQTNQPLNLQPQVVLNPNPFTGSTINFTPTLPVGASAVTINFTVVATNSAGSSSAPEFTTVTVNPQPDAVVITTAQYRTGKQRLDLTVTDSLNNPAVQLFLDPYLANDGTIFDPAKAGLGNILTFGAAPGGYTMTLVGAKPPMCRSVNGPLTTPCTVRPLTVHSNVGGVSAPTALTNIRQ